jgi:hypothetical protein
MIRTELMNLKMLGIHSSVWFLHRYDNILARKKNYERYSYENLSIVYSTGATLTKIDAYLFEYVSVSQNSMISKVE